MTNMNNTMTFKCYQNSGILGVNSKTTTTTLKITVPLLLSVLIVVWLKLSNCSDFKLTRFHHCISFNCPSLKQVSFQSL